MRSVPSSEFSRSFVRHNWRFIILIIVLFLLLLQFFNFSAQEGVPNVPVTPSSFDWSKFQFHHPVPLPLTKLPPGRPRSLPKIQHRFSRTSGIQEKRREAVRRAFLKSWNSYKKFAWMRDELTPLTPGWKNTFGGWAATLVDTMDTLWIMDLKKEFNEGVRAIAILDWAHTEESACNFFETTIRHLGGLLAAYDLSKSQTLLTKALELGDMLYAGFDTPNNLPPFWLDFAKAKSGSLLPDDHEPSATPGTLALEFTRLAQITGEFKYYDAVARIENLLYHNQNATKLPGMWPAFFNVREGRFTDDNTFTLGALSDSMYEYIPKTYAILGGLDPIYEDMYRTMAETVKHNLLFRPMTPDKQDILFSGTARVNEDITLEPEGQHLTCFIGGMYALGGKLFNLPEHVDIGARLTRGCIWAYRSMPTGIMPEIFSLVTCDSLKGCAWDEERWKAELKSDPEGSKQSLPKGFRNARDPKYILRPEALESVFILYRITGEEWYRDAAWDMFQAIMKATETPYGNAAIDDVTVTGPPVQRNSMESFWLAETLKYLYLIFSPPDLLSLDDYVFNTEAHPLIIPKP